MPTPTFQSQFKMGFKLLQKLHLPRGLSGSQYTHGLVQLHLLNNDSMKSIIASNEINYSRPEIVRYELDSACYATVTFQQIGHHLTSCKMNRLTICNRYKTVIHDDVS